MNPLKSLLSKVLRFVIERSARSSTFDDATQRLTDAAERVEQRMGQAAESERNRDVAAHITGLERWGQQRLRTALGEPFVHDEHDSYKPDASSMPGQLDAFRDTRRETVALVEQLAAANVPLTQTVLHNDAGDITVRGWLRYLEQHASREASRLK